MADLLTGFDVLAADLMRRYGFTRGGEGGFGGGMPGAEVQPNGTQLGGGPRQMKAKTPNLPASLGGILGALGDASSVIGMGLGGPGGMGPFNTVIGASERPGRFDQPGPITGFGRTLQDAGTWLGAQLGFKHDVARQQVQRAAEARRTLGTRTSFGNPAAERARRGIAARSGGTGSGGRSADPSSRGATSRGASGVGSGR